MAPDFLNTLTFSPSSVNPKKALPIFFVLGSTNPTRDTWIGSGSDFRPFC